MRFLDEFAGHPIEAHCLESLAHYVFLGLPPGGMCESILQGDLTSARSRAGITMQPRYNGGSDMVQHLHDALEAAIPKVCWGSMSAYTAWCSHFGLEGAANSVRVLFKLTIPDKDLWLEFSEYRVF